MSSRSFLPAFGDERGILRLSIAVTVFTAVLGVAFGLLAGSFSIIFDGVYSVLDAGLSLLALTVANLIAAHTTPKGGLSRRLRERFTMGFWHLEPMVLALNGAVLAAVAAYALLNAIASLMAGGRHLEFGWALVYAAFTVVICFGFAALEARANRKVESEFVRLDVKAWVMSGSITAALLIAFALGYAVQGTSWAWISPYVDPAVLGLVSLLILPMPIATIRSALLDVLLVAPPELKAHVDEVAQDFVQRCGFLSYRAYVAKVGRARQIELYFILPPDFPARTIAQWDALRDEVGAAIGDESPDRWLTVAFTGDPAWAE